MSTTPSPKQVAKRPRIRLKPGRKPARPAPRKPGRPAKAVITPTPAKAPAPKTPTPRPARKRRSTSKLPPQGIRPKGLGIRRLPQPTPAEAAALGDATAWVDCLLPRRHRSPDAAAALAHHLRLMPHLGYDEGLSIPISYLSGSIGDRALRGTTLAQARGWDALADRADLYAAVRRFVGRTCVERARSIDSPTHATSLPRSRTAALLGFPGSRRGAAATDAAVLADAAPRTHRRRANARIDALCALVDMLCGEVGPGSPVVSERTLARFLRRAADFERDAARRSFALLSRRDSASAGGFDWGESLASNREALVECFGVFGAMHRTRSLATLAAAAGRSAHRRREQIVEGLIRTAEAERKRLRALHVRFGLAGTLHDAASADLPFTPRDGAQLLGRIAGEALKGLRCAAFGVMDAHRSGHPHLHVIVVVDRGDYVRFRRQGMEAYERLGMAAWTRDGRWVDKLVHVDALDDPKSRLWRYPVAKLTPSGATATEIIADRTKITPQIRLAAWRQAHGIRATWAKNLARVGLARALPDVPEGAHPLLDAAREASRGGWDLPAALVAVDFAPKAAKQSRRPAARVVGSALDVEEGDEVVEIDVPGNHPALADVASVPGAPTDPSAFAHLEVRLRGHSGAFAVVSVRRNPDASLRAATVARTVRRRRPTKHRTIKIKEASGRDVVVSVEPRVVAVPVAVAMSQDKVDADFQRIAARRASTTSKP